MFVAVLRDAWRQYRRRPLAAVVTVAVGGLPVFFDPRTALVAVPFTVVLLVAGLLVELFMVAWLAGALAPVPTAAADALAAARRSIGPGVRAWLLRVGYLLLALLVGLLLFGPRDRLLAAADDVLRRAAGRRGHIFNLGHGILPETPFENVKAAIAMVHEYSNR